jgi:hypothetical protein
MDALVEEVKVEVEVLGSIGNKGEKSRPIRTKLLLSWVTREE